MTNVFYLKISVSDYTIKNIIEKHHLRRTSTSLEDRRSFDELTSDIMLELYRLDKNNLLPHETRLFLECRNSFSHLHTIVEKIFLNKEDVDITIRNQIKLIMEEETILTIEHRLLEIENNFEKLTTNFEESEERMKQIFFRKTGQLHGHIEFRDPEEKIIEANTITMSRIDHLEQRLESLIINSNQNIRTIMAQTIGTMLPDIISNEVGKLLNPKPSRKIQEPEIQRQPDKKYSKQSVQPSKKPAFNGFSLRPDRPDVSNDDF